MIPYHIEGLPEDPKLPALRAFNGDGLEALLAGVGVDGPFDEIRIVRYVPGSRLVLFVQGAGRPLAVKAYRRSPARTVAVLRLLESAGFAGEGAPTAAHLLGHDDLLQFTVQPWFEAPSGWELMQEGRGDRAGELAAAWVVATHQVPGKAGKNSPPAKVLGWARGWASAVSIAQPALEQDAESVLKLLAASMPRPGRPGLRHGAFGPKHVFDLGSGPGVIDWDSPKYGAVEIDCATFLAKLAKCTIQISGLAAEAEQAAESFRRGIAAIVDEDDLLWYEAAFCLKCTTYGSNMRGDRSAGHIKALLDRSVAVLTERRNNA